LYGIILFSPPSNHEEEGMRLPGTRYQEHGWEQVRKLLGQCSLQAFARVDPAPLLEPGAAAATLAPYVELAAEALHAAGRGARAAAPGNSYGDSVLELALTLVYELQARPGEWLAFCAALAAEHAKLGPFWHRPGGEALLRKKFNDMYAVLRDKVDADNYQAACGRPCSANRMYAYRMLDTAYGEIARLFAGWRENAAQVGAILGRPVDAEPIEARQLRSIADCRPGWVLRWSESLERFSGSAGPLHTRSKRFASLKDNTDKIGAMLREIGEYEQLSSNRDQDWLLDAGEATLWLDDYWRVLGESMEAATPGPDQILEEREDELDRADVHAGDEPPQAYAIDEAAPVAARLAQDVSLPPRFLELARTAQDAASWAAQVLAADSLPVRLAVYLKLLGAADDSYPTEWLDPATGELPTMQKLAALDQVSLPTLRKRRDAAVIRLAGAARP
jgi:hypothetical protein